MTTLALPGLDFVPRSDNPSDHQYTPAWLLELVAQLWPEGIDVDPAAAPDSLVSARITFDGSSPEQDGLTQPWAGKRVWCNPPYSNPTPWADRVAAHALGVDAEALLLVNVSTSTRWWARWRPRPCGSAAWCELRSALSGRAAGVPAARVAFFNRRIAFIKDGAVRDQNAYEQKLLYWGHSGNAFAQIFDKVAWVP